MGMTIDKAILRMEHSSMNVDDKETADFIIDIMRKYQKIQGVVADFNNQYNHRTPLDLMCEVKEVIEE